MYGTLNSKCHFHLQLNATENIKSNVANPWILNFWVDVGSKVYVGVKFFIHIFEAPLLYFCGSWFFEDVGGEVFVEVEFFGCIC